MSDSPKPNSIVISLDPTSDLNQSGNRAWVALRDDIVALADLDSDDDFKRLLRAERDLKAFLAAFVRRFRTEAAMIGAEEGIDVRVEHRREDLQTHNVCDADGDTWERIIWQAAHDRITDADITEMVEAAAI